MARYTVQFKPRALKDLKAIPTADQQRILGKVELLVDGLQGDVKRLTDFTPEYRLRVGPWRLLFEIAKTGIIVYRIVRREKAYR